MEMFQGLNAEDGESDLDDQEEGVEEQEDSLNE